MDVRDLCRLYLKIHIGVVYASVCSVRARICFECMRFALVRAGVLCVAHFYILANVLSVAVLVTDYGLPLAYECMFFTYGCKFLSVRFDWLFVCFWAR